MKKHLLFVFASLFLVAGSVHAQSVTLRANIPFEFVVGDTIMQAGTYTIQPGSEDGSVVRLQNYDLNDSVLLPSCICASDPGEHESKTRVSSLRWPIFPSADLDGGLRRRTSGDHKASSNSGGQFGSATYIRGRRRSWQAMSGGPSVMRRRC